MPEGEAQGPGERILLKTQHSGREEGSANFKELKRDCSKCTGACSLYLRNCLSKSTGMVSEQTAYVPGYNFQINMLNLVPHSSHVQRKFFVAAVSLG